MPSQLIIPAVGESITEVQINEWLKSEGDRVKQDEPIAVIDSEKTTFDLPAPHAGRLTKILHQAGETVAVGTVVAPLEADGEAGQAKSEATAARPAAKSTAPSKAEKPGPAEESKSDENKADEKPAKEAGGEKSPAEKSEAAEPEPAEPEKEDSQDEAGQKPAPEAARAESPSVSKTEKKTPASKPSSDREEEIVPMTMLRRTVARHLLEAQQTMAMLTTFNEVDMSGVQALRKENQEA